LMGDDGRRWQTQGEPDEREGKLCKQATLISLLQYLSERGKFRPTLKTP
jgi:hypothetical protein